MTVEDFESYGIRYFTANEVKATGASLKDVQPRLIQHLDRFRGFIGQPVHLIENGLTTGKHTSGTHRDGIAADIYTSPLDPQIAFKCALKADFRGIGLYYIYEHGWESMHLDLRSEYGFWRGGKKKTNRKWDYFPLIDTL